MAAPVSLRASDADREAVAERLRHAAVEGRLEPEELEDRLHAALRARTYGDLERLLADLPTQPVRWERRRAAAVPAARVALAVAIWAVVALAAVAAVVIAAALIAAWWMVWAVVWLALCGRRGCPGRLGPPGRWAHAPRARRVQRGRLAGYR